jgi:hypothetical protein
VRQSEGHSPKTVEWHSTALGLLVRFLEAQGITDPREFETGHLRGGWLRMTLPQADTNRTRWPTNPVWEVIQRAQFIDTPPPRREKWVAHDLEQVDAELYGLFKLRSVLCERQIDETLTLSLELRAFAERMDAVDRVRERDNHESVRENARVLRRTVPMRGAAVAQSSIRY